MAARLLALAAVVGAMDMSKTLAGTAPCSAAPSAPLADVRSGGRRRRVCEPGCVTLVGMYYSD